MGKSFIALHCDKYILPFELKTYSARSSPSGIQSALSIVGKIRLIIIKIDLKGAFLQWKKVLRDMYVIPPYQSPKKNVFYWLRLTISYNVVSTNANWQE